MTPPGLLTQPSPGSRLHWWRSDYLESFRSFFPSQVPLLIHRGIPGRRCVNSAVGRLLLRKSRLVQEEKAWRSNPFSTCKLFQSSADSFHYSGLLIWINTAARFFSFGSWHLHFHGVSNSITDRTSNEIPFNCMFPRGVWLSYNRRSLWIESENGVWDKW